MNREASRSVAILTRPRVKSVGLPTAATSRGRRSWMRFSAAMASRTFGRCFDICDYLRSNLSRIRSCSRPEGGKGSRIKKRVRRKRQISVSAFGNFSCVMCSASHPIHYAFGGYFLNIFCTPLSRFLMFLADLLERVSLAEPRQSSSFVFESNMSTTSVPTL